MAPLARAAAPLTLEGAGEILSDSRMMASLVPDDMLPVLVADLADDEAQAVLDAAASAGSQVYVPLDAAPVNASQHMLEVHLPSAPEPLFYLALPLGPPTEDGFPMRIQRLSDARPLARNEGPRGTNGLVRAGRVPSGLKLSASHTADLFLADDITRQSADSILGRALAGGKLVIESLIGSGGVGAVYKARHRELRIAVAVKVLHESFQHDIDFCRRFYAEGLAASRLGDRVQLLAGRDALNLCRRQELYLDRLQRLELIHLQRLHASRHRGEFGG